METGESSSRASGWCRRSGSEPRRTGQALIAGQSGVGTITKFDAYAVRDPDRGRGEGLRSAAVHREERRQEDGHLHPVRDRGVAVRDGRLRLEDDARDRARASACSSRRASAGSPPSSASTRRCSKAARARSRRSSSRRRSSIWRPARCRSGSAPRGRTRRPAPPARPRRTPSAMPSRSSSAATPT